MSKKLRRAPKTDNGYFEIMITDQGNLYVWPMVKSAKPLLKKVGKRREIKKINILCG